MFADIEGEVLGGADGSQKTPSRRNHSTIREGMQRVLTVFPYLSVQWPLRYGLLLPITKTLRTLNRPRVKASGSNMYHEAIFRNHTFNNESTQALLHEG